jgi:O-antigen/teichoic acid export membrane protein
LVLSVLLARLLGPAGYGSYAFAIAVFTLLQPLAGGGLGTLATRELADTHLDAACKRQRMLHFLFAALSVALVVSGAFVATVALIDRPRLGLLALALLVVPGAVLSQTAGGLLSGQHRVRLAQILTNPVKLAIVLALLAPMAVLVGGGGWSPLVALAALGLSGWIVAGIAIAFSPLKPAGTGKLPLRASSLGWLVRLSLPFAVVSTAQYLQGRVDVITLGLLATDAEVGHYQVAARMTMLVNLPATVVASLLAPRFSAAYTRGDAVGLSRNFRRGLVLSLGFALLAVAGIALVGDRLVAVVYGLAYTDSVAALYILAVGKLVMAAKAVAMVLLMMSRYERGVAAILTATALLNAAGNWALVPRYGIEGAATSTALAGILTVGAVFWLTHRSRILRRPASGLSPG